MEVQNLPISIQQEEDDPVLGEIRLLTEVSKKIGVPLQRLGRVEWFNPIRGWGLIRVPGRERALFVNAADIWIEGEPDSHRTFKFLQLIPGEVVSFELNELAPRGPRAEKVRRIPTGLA